MKAFGWSRLAFAVLAFSVSHSVLLSNESFGESAIAAALPIQVKFLAEAGSEPRVQVEETSPVSLSVLQQWNAPLKEHGIIVKSGNANFFIVEAIGRDV